MNDTINGLSLTMAIFTPKFHIKELHQAIKPPLQSNTEFCTISLTSFINVHFYCWICLINFYPVGVRWYPVGGKASSCFCTQPAPMISQRAVQVVQRAGRERGSQGARRAWAQTHTLCSLSRRGTRNLTQLHCPVQGLSQNLQSKYLLQRTVWEHNHTQLKHIIMSVT